MHKSLLVLRHEINGNVNILRKRSTETKLRRKKHEKGSEENTERNCGGCDGDGAYDRMLFGEGVAETGRGGFRAPGTGG